MGENCQKCLFAELCQFSRPCDYYAPTDYEDRIADREEQRRAEKFYDEWWEYAEEWGEDNFF